MAEYGRVRCTGNAELREAEEAEDQDRVEDNIEDRTGGLADHTKLCASRGLQKSLEVHLEEQAQRKAGYDGEICVAVLNDLSSCCGVSAGLELHSERPVRAEDREQQERDEAAECQEDAHIGGRVGLVEALLAEGTGEQRVHTDAGTGADRDHQVLQRKCVCDCGERVLTESCDENAVHYIVKGLYQHRDHHGKRHTDDQLFNGHDAHFVFFGSVGCHVHFSFGCVKSLLSQTPL